MRLIVQTRMLWCTVSLRVSEVKWRVRIFKNIYVEYIQSFSAWLLVCCTTVLCIIILMLHFSVLTLKVGNNGNMVTCFMTAVKRHL